MEKHEPNAPQGRVWMGDAAWRPRSQATFLAGRSDESYWLLVEQLMHLGWHRLGKRSGTGRVWGFRHGYTLPDRPGDAALTSAQERWIQAINEITAMHRLLREVRGR